MANIRVENMTSEQIYEEISVLEDAKKEADEELKRVYANVKSINSRLRELKRVENGDVMQEILEKREIRALRDDLREQLNLLTDSQLYAVNVAVEGNKFASLDAKRFGSKSVRYYVCKEVANMCYKQDGVLFVKTVKGDAIQVTELIEEVTE